jgi:hypothetical protein
MWKKRKHYINVFPVIETIVVFGKIIGMVWGSFGLNNLSNNRYDIRSTVTILHTQTLESLPLPIVVVMETMTIYKKL